LNFKNINDLKVKKIPLFKTSVLIAIMSLITYSCGVKDKDGNTYKTIKINNQVWLKENLNVSTLCNGDIIPEAKTEQEWEQAGQEGKPVWCYSDDPESDEKLGKLYNWFAVNDPRKIAPEGWHIPSDEEWGQLINFLGGAEIAGSKLKHTNGWNRDGNGTDEVGFSALPGGTRANNGLYNDSGTGTIGCWWSSTETYNQYAWVRYMSFTDGRIYKDYYYKQYGFSVRCIKD